MMTNSYFCGFSSAAAAPTAVENPLRGGGRRGSLKVGCALLGTLAVLSCYGGDGPGPLAPDAEHEPALPTVFSPFTAAAEQADDRQHLTDLYNATGGNSWNSRTNWLDSTAALNDWYGVTADGSDVVSKLWLGSNNLAGSVPGSLGGLSGLDTLNFGANGLSGSLPSELGDLSNLVYLSFWNNDLTGEIPAALGSLSELYHLSVSANDISGEVPAELGNQARRPLPLRQPVYRCASLGAHRSHAAAPLLGAQQHLPLPPWRQRLHGLAERH